MPTGQDYCAQHGPMSNPAEHAHLFDQLPQSIAGLAEIVQNVTIHPFWVDSYGLSVPPERMGELQLRSIRRRLGRTLELDPRPLDAPRPLEAKLLGNCRDHSLLLASLLRQQGIPARARCGFGAYFVPGHFVDHWVTEYWDADRARWVMVDAQLDALQRETLGIGFDPLDVPRDQFIVGGRAWQMCRSGEQDPDAFGIFDMKGLGFVRGNLVRDVAALNAMELLPWDCWGVILSESLDDPDDLGALNTLADQTAGDVPQFAEVRERYLADARLRVDGRILSFVEGRMVPVDLGEG